jgi:hypothetical protein
VAKGAGGMTHAHFCDCDECLGGGIRRALPEPVAEPEEPTEPPPPVVWTERRRGVELSFSSELPSSARFGT